MLGNHSGLINCRIPKRAWHNKKIIKKQKQRRSVTAAICTLNHGIQQTNILNTRTRDEVVQYLYDRLINIAILATQSREIVSPGRHNYSQTLTLIHSESNKYIYSPIHGGSNPLQISKHGKTANKEKTDNLRRKRILLRFLRLKKRD
jgi:hypothetical protein